MSVVSQLLKDAEGDIFTRLFPTPISIRVGKVEITLEELIDDDDVETGGDSIGSRLEDLAAAATAGQANGSSLGSALTNNGTSHAMTLAARAGRNAMARGASWHGHHNVAPPFASPLASRASLAANAEAARAYAVMVRQMLQQGGVFRPAAFEEGYHLYSQVIYIILHECLIYTQKHTHAHTHTRY